MVESSSENQSQRSPRRPITDQGMQSASARARKLPVQTSTRVPPHSRDSARHQQRVRTVRNDASLP